MDDASHGRPSEEIVFKKLLIAVVALGCLGLAGFWRIGLAAGWMNGNPNGDSHKGERTTDGGHRCAWRHGTVA
jgi:hypothetical protein